MLASLLPANYPPGQDSGHLLAHNRYLIAFYGKSVLLIYQAGLFVGGHQELPLCVGDVGNPAGNRSTVDVNVQWRQENADESGCVPGIHGQACNTCDTTVGWGHDSIGILWWHTLGISKKEGHEKGQQEDWQGDVPVTDDKGNSRQNCRHENVWQSFANDSQILNSILFETTTFGNDDLTS